MREGGHEAETEPAYLVASDDVGVCRGGLFVRQSGRGRVRPAVLPTDSRSSIPPAPTSLLLEPFLE